MRRLGQKSTKHIAGIEDLPGYDEWGRGNYSLFVHQSNANKWTFGVFTGDPVEGLLAQGERGSEQEARHAAEYFANRLINDREPRLWPGDWYSKRL